MGLGWNLPKEAYVWTSFTQSPALSVDWCDIAHVTIDMIPDVALLRIFDFYLDEGWRWYTLVHVCQKWRNVVFGSPRRLNLRLRCTAGTQVRETLEVWPPLPIAIRAFGYETWGVDNIIAALGHNNRICKLDLFTFPIISSSQLEMVLAAMQKPFPALTRPHLRDSDETAPADPDLFLGGSAPRLQTLILNRVPLAFPGLPKLILSATHLVHLHLQSITETGYISPEAMVTCLSVSTKLEKLELRFDSPLRHPDRKNRRPHPPTRTLLPVLTEFQFKGVDEYLEDLVALIDAPLLDILDITLFRQPIFHTPQLTQFISRTPKFKSHDEAEMMFSSWGVRITISQTSDGALKLSIPCGQSDLQLSSLVQVCSSTFPRALITAVEHLYILENNFLQLHWKDDIESNQWLELFRPFTAVKGPYISEKFTPRIAPTLKELVGERAMEVLPVLLALLLEEIHLSGPVQEVIGKFVAARQLAGQPIAVSHWGEVK
jgi:hypothetical protein